MMQRINFNEYYKKIRQRSLRENLQRLLNVKGKPSQIALSIAVGLFVGLIIPMGFQTIVVIPLAIFLDCNILLASLATTITNPLTIIPLYIAAVKTGEWVLNQPDTLAGFAVILNNPSAESLYHFGKDGLMIFLTGMLIIGLFVSAASYVLILHAVRIYRTRKNLL